MTWATQSPKSVLDSLSQILIFFRAFRAFRGLLFSHA